MELFRDKVEEAKVNALYAQARAQGPEWLAFVELCFDGGDNVDEAAGLLRDRLVDSCPAEVFFEAE